MHEMGQLTDFGWQRCGNFSRNWHKWDITLLTRQVNMVICSKNTK